MQLLTQANGICEGFHRTIQEEFYSVAFRKKLYRTIDELKTDADAWIREYIEERAHSGRYCYGKTPMQPFLDANHLAHEKTLDRLTRTTPTDDDRERAEPETERSHAPSRSDAAPGSAMQNARRIAPAGGSLFSSGRT